MQTSFTINYNLYSPQGASWCYEKVNLLNWLSIHPVCTVLYCIKPTLLQDISWITYQHRQSGPAEEDPPVVGPVIGIGAWPLLVLIVVVLGVVVLLLIILCRVGICLFVNDDLLRRVFGDIAWKVTSGCDWRRRSLLWRRSKSNTANLNRRIIK